MGIERGRQHYSNISEQLTCSSYKYLKGNVIRGYRHNECCQINLQHVSTGLRFNVVFRIISKDPKLEVLGLNVDSNLERIPQHKKRKYTSGSYVEVQRKACVRLTGENVTDFYVRNYLFQFGSGHWKSLLRLFLDILRPSRKMFG
jgi:hypothetical protein